MRGMPQDSQDLPRRVGSQRVLFVLADGARARFVEQSAKSGDFVTLDEIDGREDLRQLRRELRASHPVRTHDSTTPRSHAVGREDYFRQAKETFTARVAEMAGAFLRERGFDEVFVAAPARLIGPLRDQLSEQVSVVGTLERDLTKTPDKALSRWLASALSAEPEL